MKTEIKLFYKKNNKNIYSLLFYVVLALMLWRTIILFQQDMLILFVIVLPAVYSTIMSVNFFNKVYLSQKDIPVVVVTEVNLIIMKPFSGKIEIDLSKIEHIRFLKTTRGEFETMIIVEKGVKNSSFVKSYKKMHVQSIKDLTISASEVIKEFSQVKNLKVISK